MSVEFNTESIEKAWDELMPLTELHYEEIARYKDIALNPDKDKYVALDNKGFIRFFTIRSEDKLVGYAIFFIAPHIHYSDVIHAHQDVIFLSKAHRGKLIGMKFVKWCDERLKENGVKWVTQHVKAKHNFGRMLEHVGYELMDLVYSKRLD